ncbi:MAG: hypothetical protein IKA48_00395 [Fibrobacter sp.]|nr:hypothetical protein [Fibrobacter sp.]
MENRLVIEGVADCSAEQALLKQTFTRVEYVISACYPETHKREFFAALEYGNFTRDISKATRYSTFTEALDKVDILKKNDLENIQIHEFNTTMSIGRTVTA